MNNQPDDLRCEALEASVYHPEYKQETPIAQLELKEFDAGIIKEHIRGSVDLLAYNRAHRPLLIEIVDVLDQNKQNFLIDSQQYFSFYWNGRLVYQVLIKGEFEHTKDCHISYYKYKTEKARLHTARDQLVRELQFYRWAGWSMFASVAIIGICQAASLIRKIR